MKRYRTVFPGAVSFHNWWIRSKNEVIGQLKKRSRNEQNDIIYHIFFPKHKVEGNGIWTSDTLIKAGAIICETREELKKIPNENKIQTAITIRHPPIISRPRRSIRRK